MTKTGSTGTPATKTTSTYSRVQHTAMITHDEHMHMLHWRRMTLAWDPLKLTQTMLRTIPPLIKLPHQSFEFLAMHRSKLFLCKSIWSEFTNKVRKLIIVHNKNVAVQALFLQLPQAPHLIPSIGSKPVINIQVKLMMWKNHLRIQVLSHPLKTTILTIYSPWHMTPLTSL